MIFKDKTVIITGGSEGVGAAVARLFADAGANLMLVARGKKKLEALAVELREKTRVELFAMDVADTEAAANLMKKTAFEFGQIDILINNAGYHERGAFADVAPADLAAMVDVNLRAPMVLSRLVLPHMEEAGGGVIINVGSLAGRTFLPGAVAYASTKAGLRSLSYSLAEEMLGGKIKIGLVSPGPIDTGFIMDDIDSVSNLVFSQPLATAKEVAQAIVDLCGNEVREHCMHPSSRIMTTLTYLVPWLGRQLRPVLDRRGAAAKAKLKAARIEAHKAEEKKNEERKNLEKRNGKSQRDA